VTSEQTAGVERQPVDPGTVDLSDRASAAAATPPLPKASTRSSSTETGRVKGR
jgi:hypothetical protein